MDRRRHTHYAFWLIILMTVCGEAWGQWATNAWPAYLHPREGAQQCNDCYSGLVERIHARNGALAPLPSMFWWRGGKGNLGTMKASLATIIGSSSSTEQYWIPTNVVGNTNQTIITATLNNGDMTLDGLTKTGMLVTLGLPTNFFSYTPWRGLAGDGIVSNDYGWDGMRRMLEQLVAGHSDTRHLQDTYPQQFFPKQREAVHSPGTATWAQVQAQCEAAVPGALFERYAGIYQRVAVEFFDLSASEMYAQKMDYGMRLENGDTTPTNGYDIPFWIFIKTAALYDPVNDADAVYEYDNFGEAMISTTAGTKMTVITNNSHEYWDMWITGTNLVTGHWPTTDPNPPTTVEHAFRGYRFLDDHTQQYTNFWCVVYDFRDLMKWK